MIRIVIDHDIVVVPEPIATIVIIVGPDLEEEVTHEEPLAVAAVHPPDMLRANTEGEASMFPRMVHMKVRVAAAVVMSYPPIVLMHMRELGMIRMIVESAPLFLRRRRGVPPDRSAITVGRYPSVLYTILYRATLTSWRCVRCADGSGTARGNKSAANLPAATHLRLGWLGRPRLLRWL